MGKDGHKLNYHWHHGVSAGSRRTPSTDHPGSKSSISDRTGVRRRKNKAARKQRRRG